MLRLLRATNTAELALRLSRLRLDDLSGDVTMEAIGYLASLFGSIDAPGVAMAVRAAGPSAVPDTTAASLTTLASDLLSAL